LSYWQEGSGGKFVKFWVDPIGYHRFSRNCVTLHQSPLGDLRFISVIFRFVCYLLTPIYGISVCMRQVKISSDHQLGHYWNISRMQPTK
jgi:hypothetical protein